MRIYACIHKALLNIRIAVDSSRQLLSQAIVCVWLEQTCLKPSALLYMRQALIRNVLMLLNVHNEFKKE